jgi:hypothetical protein
VASPAVTGVPQLGEIGCKLGVVFEYGVKIANWVAKGGASVGTVSAAVPAASDGGCRCDVPPYGEVGKRLPDDATGVGKVVLSE